MNNEGAIYLNDNLKINAVKLSIILQLHNATHRLFEEAKACTSDQCLSNLEQQLKTYRLNKARVAE